MLRFQQSCVFFTLILATVVHCENSKEKGKYEVIPIAGRFTHAEGPHWDHRSQKLYFVDIAEQKIRKLDPVTLRVESTFIANGPVGVAIPIADAPDQFVAGAGLDFVQVSWNGERNTTRSPIHVLATVDQNHQGNRWNDGKVDSAGRFWGGTIGPEENEVVIPNQATFYRIGKDFVPEVKLRPVTNSNGLAWNLQDDTFYYIDTPTLQIVAFDYEPISGTISNRRIAFDLKMNNITGYPDGMTIDTDGNLWIALYNGGGVIKVNPHTKSLLLFVELPVKKVTSVAFGGPLMDLLYVTTSSRGLTKEELNKEPYAGYVFVVKGLNVHGLIANTFEMGAVKP